MNGDERLKINSVTRTLWQIRQLSWLKTKLNNGESGQTHKDIHKHVLQGDLQVLKSCCESHCSADPKNATEQNQLSIKTKTLALFFSVIRCIHGILADELKEVVKPCQSYDFPILQMIVPRQLLTVQPSSSTFSFHSPSKTASQTTSCSPNRIKNQMYLH